MACVWGNLGKNSGPVGADANGGSGYSLWIERDVMPGVEYHALPADAALPSWQPEGQDELRFRLPLAGSMGNARSVCELRGELEALPPGAADGPVPPECLSELDRLAQRLLDAADRFHRQVDHGASPKTRGLGLLCPENVLFFYQDDQFQLLLVDAGFTWDPQVGRPPSWLHDGQRWRFLWDFSPLRVNQMLRDGGAACAAFDLRTIARLFAWLLLGEEINGWNDGSPIERIPVRRVASQTAADIWDVLDCVLSGQISTADQFHQQIDACGGLSSHFRTPPQTIRQPPLQRMPLVASALFAAALVGILSWRGCIGTPAKQPRSVLCPECPERSALAPHLAELERVLRRIDLGEADLAAAVAVVSRLHAAERASVKEAAIREELCLADIRAEFLQRCARAQHQLIVRLMELPYHDATECGEIRQVLQLAGEVLRLGETEELPPWYQSLKRLEEEYGCR